MRIKQIVESQSFDEQFIRSVAKDKGVDLSKHDTDAVRKMHDQIVRNATSDNFLKLNGQDYYDACKEYFS